MTNRPVETDDSVEGTFHEARQLHEQVDEHLRDGEMAKAKRAFSQNWRDAVPELPFRFHSTLQRPDSQAVLALRAQLRPGVRVPELRLNFVGGRRNPQTVEIWTVGRPRLRLGDLPSKDLKFLKEIGNDADLYSPSLLEIRVTSGMKLDYVAIELARDEIQICGSCGAKHEGPRLLCDRCSRRKRSGDEEERVDATPIAFHEAVEAIAAEHETGDDNEAFLG